ncbi:MAG: hypothetical protein HYX40_05315 [Sphingobacteriales bacterium]|nr:hypothetical protein [Sphingobacteriales bacterium]
MNQKNLKEDLLVLLLSGLLVILLFSPILLSPNSFLFGPTSDGLKNYYTILYYLQHDNGLHFTGMNYPFGEHLSFADAQVGLVVPYKWLCYLFPSLKNNGVALVNLAAILQLIAGIFFVYKLLRHFSVSFLFSLAGAILLIFLSPQLFRLQAHYALTYSFFLPMSWYFFIKAEEEEKYWWTIATILLIAWIGLLHLYLALICTLFFFAYSLLSTLTGLQKKLVPLHLKRWAITVGPLLLLKIFMLLTDPVADRPSKPWGFFFAMADFDTVFLPHPTDLFGNPAKELPGYGEGFAYVGMTVNVILCCLILYFLFTLITGKFKNFIQLNTKRQHLFFLSSIIVLLFSMAIPFKWGLEFIVDTISFLRQFRSPGRFAWAFYYVAGIFCIKYLYQFYCWVRNKKLQKTAVTIVLAATVIWGTEDYYRYKTVKRFSEPGFKNFMLVNEPSLHSLLIKSGEYAQNYQALLAFPFFHVGSEKFSFDQGAVPFYAMRASMQWQLPMLNVMMSRTSLKQSCETVQLLSDSLIEKEILGKLGNKPILLLVTEPGLSAAEQYIVNKSQLIASQGSLSLYKLFPSDLAKKSEWATNLYKDTLLVNHGNYRSSVIESNAVIKFITAAKDMVDGNAMQKPATSSSILFDDQLIKVNTNDTMLVSLWIKINPLSESLPLFRCEQLNTKGEVIDVKETAFKWSYNVYHQCLLAEVPVVIKSDFVKLRISMHGESKYANLVIRRKNENILVTSGSSVFFNNIPVE